MTSLETEWTEEIIEGEISPPSSLIIKAPSLRLAKRNVAKPSWQHKEAYYYNIKKKCWFHLTASGAINTSAPDDKKEVQAPSLPTPPTTTQSSYRAPHNSESRLWTHTEIIDSDVKMELVIEASSVIEAKRKLNDRAWPHDVAYFLNSARKKWFVLTVRSAARGAAAKSPSDPKVRPNLEAASSLRDLIYNPDMSSPSISTQPQTATATSNVLRYWKVDKVEPTEDPHVSDDLVIEAKSSFQAKNVIKESGWAHDVAYFHNSRLNTWHKFILEEGIAPTPITQPIPGTTPGGIQKTQDGPLIPRRRSSRQSTSSLEAVTETSEYEEDGKDVETKPQDLKRNDTETKPHAAVKAAVAVPTTTAISPPAGSIQQPYQKIEEPRSWNSEKLSEQPEGIHEILIIKAISVSKAKRQLKDSSWPHDVAYCQIRNAWYKLTLEGSHSPESTLKDEVLSTLKEVVVAESNKATSMVASDEKALSKDKSISSLTESSKTTSIVASDEKALSNDDQAGSSLSMRAAIRTKMMVKRLTVKARGNLASAEGDEGATKRWTTLTGSNGSAIKRKMTYAQGNNGSAIRAGNRATLLNMASRNQHRQPSNQMTTTFESPLPSASDPDHISPESPKMIIGSTNRKTRLSSFEKVLPRVVKTTTRIEILDEDIEKYENGMNGSSDLASKIMVLEMFLENRRIKTHRMMKMLFHQPDGLDPGDQSAMQGHLLALAITRVTDPCKILRKTQIWPDGVDTNIKALCKKMIELVQMQSSHQAAIQGCHAYLESADNEKEDVESRMNKITGEEQSEDDLWLELKDSLFRAVKTCRADKESFKKCFATIQLRSNATETCIKEVQSDLNRLQRTQANPSLLNIFNDSLSKIKEAQASLINDAKECEKYPQHFDEKMEAVLSQNERLSDCLRQVGDERMTVEEDESKIKEWRSNGEKLTVKALKDFNTGAKRTSSEDHSTMKREKILLTILLPQERTLKSLEDMRLRAEEEKEEKIMDEYGSLRNVVCDEDDIDEYGSLRNVICDEDDITGKLVNEDENSTNRDDTYEDDEYGERGAMYEYDDENEFLQRDNEYHRNVRGATEFIKIMALASQWHRTDFVYKLVETALENTYTIGTQSFEHADLLTGDTELDSVSEDPAE